MAASNSNEALSVTFTPTLYRKSPRMGTLPYYLITRLKERAGQVTLHTQIAQFSDFFDITKKIPLPVRSIAYKSETSLAELNTPPLLAGITALLNHYIKQDAYEKLSEDKKEKFIERLTHLLDACMSHMKNSFRANIPLNNKEIFYGLCFDLKFDAESIKRNSNVIFPPAFLTDAIIKYAIHQAALEFNLEKIPDLAEAQKSQLQQEFILGHESFQIALYRFICGTIQSHYGSSQVLNTMMDQLLWEIVGQISFEACINLMFSQKTWIYTLCADLLKVTEFNDDYIQMLLNIIEENQLYLDEASWQALIAPLKPELPPEREHACSVKNIKEDDPSLDNLSIFRRFSI